jgi:long-chain acyl-CoA synthetase
MLPEAEMGSPEFWAAQTPDAIAVVKDGKTLTYESWNDQANRVADALAARGLKAGDRIGMRFRLNFQWFIVQRALQKIGVMQVAVNWKLTPDEADFIVRDSGARGLVCDDVNAAGWATKEFEFLITVGQGEGSLGLRFEDLLAQGNPTERFGPARAAMILYTSGTTGQPKGVPPTDLETVDLARLMRYGASVATAPPMVPKAATLLSLPVHHGAGPAIASGTCAVGGTCVLLDPYDPEEALKLIEAHKISVWTAVPTMLLRIQSLPDGLIDKYDVSSIQALSTGAAPVPQSLKEWIVERMGENVLWEQYGCSEAGMLTYIAPEHQLTKPGSSGLPFDGVDIAIIDEDWNRLATGEKGEIAVNTPLVLKNYISQEALGEDVVKDGYYRTGDVGYLDEDGFLFITDRIKDMIVAGGVNVYPAEIEKAIVAHADVEDCAVIGVPHDDLGEKPLAFIVRKAGAGITGNDILSFLEGRLASFKKPRDFEFVDQLPINPMGKVLKTELRAPYWKDK